MAPLWTWIAFGWMLGVFTDRLYYVIRFGPHIEGRLALFEKYLLSLQTAQQSAPKVRDIGDDITEVIASLKAEHREG